MYSDYSSASNLSCDPYIVFDGGIIFGSINTLNDVLLYSGRKFCPFSVRIYFVILLWLSELTLCIWDQDWDPSDDWVLSGTTVASEVTFFNPFGRSLVDMQV